MTKNELYFSEDALELAYGDVEYKKFPRQKLHQTRQSMQGARLTREEDSREGRGGAREARGKRENVKRLITEPGPPTLCYVLAYVDICP